MRTYHYAILFAIIAVIFVTLRDISYSEVVMALNSKTEYESSFSRAVDSAVEELIFDENGCIFQSKEFAYQTFLHSMTTAFDLNMDSEGRQRLELFLPIVAIADEDGLYVYYYKEEQTSGKHLERVWTERIPYEVEYQGIHYEFTLSGSMTCYDEEENRIETTILSEEYEQLRCETISSLIENTLTEYINQHNKIATQYGVQYEFHIPSIDNSMNSRAITSPSFLVMFQGYPMHGTSDVFQSYAFAGATLKKNGWYVLTKKDWYYIYHRQDCEELHKLNGTMESYEDIICNTKEECAQYGAYPCSHCLDVLENYSYLHRP